MASFLYGEQEEPFQAQQSPSPPSSPTNPYEKSLARYRSNSSSAGSRRTPYTASSTATGLARQPSFGAAGQAVGVSSPQTGLFRKRTNSTGPRPDASIVQTSPLVSTRNVAQEPASLSEDVFDGTTKHETFDIPERDEESPAPPPVWERRKSMIVRAEEREREQRIQRELQAYQAEQNSQRKAQEEADAIAKSGKGLFRRPKSKSGLDKPASVAEGTPARGSKEMNPNLKIPITSSRRRPHSMLQMTSSSGNSNQSGSHTSATGDADLNGRLPSHDGFGAQINPHSSEDLDSPLPMPNAAFLNGGYSSPGHSRRSSSSSLRGSPSRRTSAYGSPLGLTGEGLTMSLSPIPAVPDQSNPTRLATERPLDTVRQMSMRTERNPDQISSGATTPRDHGSYNNGIRRSKVPPPAGVILDESIWPSAPVMMAEPVALAKSLRSRSNVSLVSLGKSNKTFSRSTPNSPMVKGKQSADMLSPVSSRSTMGRSSAYGSPVATTREYMIPISQREGGYAIAATMQSGTGSGYASRTGSVDFGRSTGYNRYSVDSGMDEYGMYHRGHNASRPSLPGQSTSTSTTSLYQPEYQAPPSAFPAHMSAEQKATVIPGAGLSKTPSPLSTATNPAVEAESGETPELDDIGLQMRTRQSSAVTPNRASTPMTSSVGRGKQGNQPSTPVDTTPTKPTAPAIVAAPETATPVKKSKKEVAREAKEAKDRRKAEEKQKAIEASRAKAEAAREKKKREDAERAKKEAEKKAAKLRAKQEKELAKSNKKLASKGKPAPSALVMPATPLKGRTKDLSAATPTSLPTTPATPAEPVRLLDMVSSSGQTLDVRDKPLPLSTQAILASVSKEQHDRSQTIPNGMQTPQRKVPPSATAQSPAISSVKSKRSLFGTLRKKFGSSPAPVASSRGNNVNRDRQATSVPGNSGIAPMLSIPSTKAVDQNSSTSGAVSSADAVVETPEGATTDPINVDISPQSLSGELTSSALATDSTMRLAATAPLTGESTQPGVHATSDHLAASMSSAGQSDSMLSKGFATETETAANPDDAATMISKAKQGGLNVDLHVKYIQDLDTKTDELAYHMTEHLRLNGVYWGLVALCLLNRPEALNREDMIKYVLSCWDEEAGAFGAHPRHDGHILATLSAIQILAIQDALDLLHRERIVHFITSLIDPVTGAVAGDRWGEQDTRFSYIAVSILSLIGRLDVLDSALEGRARDLLVGHIARCRNFDGGFGATEGSESHGGQIFVCVAALAILDRLDLVDTPALAWWISERQLPNGGLNGRPEKLEDVCYSWWNLSALSILGKLHWINRDQLINFILKSQDLENGGIADRPGDWVDVFHTNFGLAGLSLLGYAGLRDIDPVYCMPVTVIERLGLKKRYQALPMDGIFNQSENTLVEGDRTDSSIPALAPPLPLLTAGGAAESHEP
ncbi:hypothetical protein NliqN6_3590 [Naganishia liquefaciens]|uniref:Geranylgeranyl transferase type-2 subunit beta n=1 Tax=Naganishia liquefaciens TaxID=104408 RepID=A0A8H3YFD8_9TREE|nr:hypothetical protein NliqN6_3590 [Naganishia liquefaciens]